ncbi:hypothetical protein MJG53_009691 [Ovis ammon polii x Ovis aries]|uniref:Uncharacterized protein n=1 Tax=Ovis ammon polii x Ovis aries TaxID=2918886 RepID=A0ACB9UX27_9CETA|nr:hypothetical protein MJG53_009691 [Ovis ammon polii x Ovis aries]
MTSTLTAWSSVLSWVWLEAELPLWCFPSTFAPVLTRTSIPWLSFYIQCKETHVLWPHRLSNFMYKTLRFTRSVAAHRHPRKFHAQSYHLQENSYKTKPEDSFQNSVIDFTQKETQICKFVRKKSLRKVLCFIRLVFGYLFIYLFQLEIIIDEGEEKSLEQVEITQQEAVNKYVIEKPTKKTLSLGSETSLGFLLYCDRRSGRLARYNKFGETGVSEYTAEVRKQLMDIFSVAANQITVRADVEQPTALSWLANFAACPQSMLNEEFTRIWKIRHSVTIN